MKIKNLFCFILLISSIVISFYSYKLIKENKKLIEKNSELIKENKKLNYRIISINH